MLTIRKVFQKKSKKQQKQQKKKKHESVASSTIASSSSNSSPTSSQPTTPTSGPFVHDARGIFRTLEPIWYYSYPTTAGELEWMPFDPHCQTVLEVAYTQNKASCDLGQQTIVHFTPGADDGGWVLDDTVRRVISPVWWYEQDSIIDGSKGMCRFDYKNQARLEALADEDRSKLSMVDEAFPHPFTITLVNRSRDQKEEWRGFLHLEFPAVYVSNPYEKDYFYQESLQQEEYTTGRRFSI
ncbi:hypothetical protein BJV82DRAFT_579691 [Fennellomyces sp. T-0311]|nr:hypothetical protein BJV82DRAFT_579691 [Fennellomyces sp. T-0311]